MKYGCLKMKQQGMTLIEIMIALILGLFLITGVLQIFLGAKQSNRMLDNLSRMQENGRFAMDFISRDIRMAGFSEECSKPPAGETNIVPLAIAGTNDDGLNNSDSITTKVSDAACPIAGATLVTTPTVFSIGGTASKPGLYRKVGAGATQELIEGIENMQILYGVDNDDDKTPDYYMPVDPADPSVVDMEKVVSVRVNLLAVSLDNNLSAAPVDYQFNGNTVTPATGDRRLRREFSSTIAVRNRLP